MIFSKLFNKTSSDKDDNESLTEEQLADKKMKLIKSINRRNMLKKIALYIFVGLGVLGGYRSLTSTTPTTTYNELQDQSFISEYLLNYYNYPSSESNQKYIEKFTYSTNNLHQKNDYTDEVASASVNSSQIYRVTVDDQEKNTYNYYVKSNFDINLKEGSTKSTVIYNKITVAKKGSRYKVVRPINNIAYNIASITDEDVLSDYKYESEEGSTQVEDDVKSKIENTIDLFVKTYNDDLSQAKLLVNISGGLEPLDPNTRLEFERITNSSSDDTTYFVECAIIERYSSYSSATKNYHFEIDIDKNKITKMEVY